MTKHQYFGDSRDYFKYDFLLHLRAAGNQNRHLIIVPMLTADDQVGGNHAFDQLDERNAGLAAILRQTRYAIRGNQTSITWWRQWLNGHNIASTFVPGGNLDAPTYTGDYEHVQLAAELAVEMDCPKLVFFDPDNGVRQPFTQPDPAYIACNHLAVATNAIDDHTLIVIYNHLGNNANHRAADLGRRMGQALVGCNALTWCMGYEEDQIAFLVLGRSDTTFAQVRNTISDYPAEGRVHRLLAYWKA